MNRSRGTVLLLWHMLMAVGIALITIIPMILYLLFPPWLVLGSQIGTTILAMAGFSASASAQGVFSFIAMQQMLNIRYRMHLSKLILWVIGFLALICIAFVLAGLLGAPLLLSPFLLLAAALFIYSYIIIHVWRKTPLACEHSASQSKAWMIFFIVPCGVLLVTASYLVHDRYTMGATPQERRDQLVMSSYQGELGAVMNAMATVPAIKNRCGADQSFYPSAVFQQMLIGTMDGIAGTMVLEGEGTCQGVFVALCNTIVGNSGIGIGQPYISEQLEKHIIVFNKGGFWQFYDPVHGSLLQGMQGISELRYQLLLNKGCVLMPR